MMHKARVFCLSEFTDLEALVESLKEYSWTLCTGFQYKSLLLINDSVSEDSLQEYAVVRNGVQIESLTVSWYDPDKLKGDLTTLDSVGSLDGSAITFGKVDVQTHSMTERCALCA